MLNKQKIIYYYKLTKPGIVRGNSISVLAGFLLASQGRIDLDLMIYTIFASALVMAGGCVLNNYIDRDIDSKMSRTKTRALASKKISPIGALIYGGILTILGFVILYFQTNILTVYVGIIGFIFYVYVYGYFKRKSEHSTLIGSVAGAIPPVVGYVAVSNNYDIGALLVFLVLVFWQMPHFYAIAIFRRKEYAQAELPILTITRGVDVTRKYIVGYLLIYLIIACLPFMYGLVGFWYLSIVSSANLYWLYITISKYDLDDDKWAKKVFGASLLSLSAFCLAILMDTVL